jgi:hypothetical protein
LALHALALSRQNHFSVRFRRLGQQGCRLAGGRQILQRALHSVWCLIQDDGPLPLARDVRQLPQALWALAWQETEDAEAVRRCSTGNGQRCDRRARPWNGRHAKAGVVSSCDHSEARVADQWGACIRDQRHIGALTQRGGHHTDTLSLIVLVAADDVRQR